PRRILGDELATAQRTNLSRSELRPLCHLGILMRPALVGFVLRLLNLLRLARTQRATLDQNGRGQRYAAHAREIWLIHGGFSTLLAFARKVKMLPIWIKPSASCQTYAAVLPR